MSDPDPAAVSQTTSRLGADFGTRVISAIAMAAVALALTWAGGWAFAGLLMVGSCILLWEWAGMTGGATSGPVFWTQCVAAVAMIAAVMFPNTGLGLMPTWVLAWAAGSAVLTGWGAYSDPEDAVIGLNYVALPAVALVWLRNDPAFGLTVTLFLFVIVWGTDILAYVCGRSFGGAKLWPAVSPKKTWSGAIGGTLAAVIGGIIVATMIPEASILRLAIVALLLSVVSQIGDLAESALKRHFGIKDSSSLIPGHGGLLDRVDGLLFAAFAAGLFALLTGPNDLPGKTVLVGG